MNRVKLAVITERYNTPQLVEDFPTTTYPGCPPRRGGWINTPQLVEDFPNPTQGSSPYRGGWINLPSTVMNLPRSVGDFSLKIDKEIIR